MRTASKLLQNVTGLWLMFASRLTARKYQLVRRKPEGEKAAIVNLLKGLSAERRTRILNMALEEVIQEEKADA